MEFDEPLLLCGFEALQDFGLALPLYKFSRSSNAWYVHSATKPFDLGSSISGFELFHPQSPAELDEPHQLVSVGERSRIVFLWNARVHIDDVYNILSHLDARRELERYVPITLTDFLLYSRSPRFGSAVKRSHRYVRQRFGTASAERWFSNILIKQALKVDLDRIIELTLRSPGFESGTGLATALGQIEVVARLGDKIILSYPEALDTVLHLTEIDPPDLTFTGQACRAVGKEVSLQSASHITRSVGAVTSTVLKSGTDRPEILHSAIHRSHSQEDVYGRLQIEVSGQGVKTGETLRQTVSTRFTETLQGFGLSTGRAFVTFSKGPHDYGFACVLRYSRRGIDIVATGAGSGPNAALDQMLKHARSQLRKLLGRAQFDHRRSLNAKEVLRAGLEEDEAADDM